jgi:hypothetical protein
MTVTPSRLSCQPNERASSVAAWLTGFPAAAPFSSSQASQWPVTQILSTHRAPMSALSA